MYKLLLITLICFLLIGCNYFRHDSQKVVREASVTQATHVKSPKNQRLFLVVLDFSSSYSDYENVLQALIAELKDLGPGDRFVLARIPGRLNPKDFVLIDASTDKPADEIFTPSTNLNEWRRKTAVLEIAWREVSKSSQTISSVLQKLHGANKGTSTDLYSAVIYGVRWLHSQDAVEPTLIICTDLEHDLGTPTFAPPATKVDVSDLRVRLLFVTYRNNQHWEKLETEWRKYFGDAADLEILDSGRSANEIFTPSQMPHKLPSLLSNLQSAN
jgi:hypothetical protein